MPVGVPFFLWVGIFNLMIVAQFWSFANDLYTKDQGERLFPIVAFGASLGAVVGSLLTKRLIPLVGVPQLLLVAAALLAIAAVTEPSRGCARAAACGGRDSSTGSPRRRYPRRLVSTRSSPGERRRR